MHIDTEIDLSGLRCPLPVLRVKKALGEMASGGVLRAFATDPGAAEDIPAFIRQTGAFVARSQAGRRRALFSHRQTMNSEDAPPIGLLSVSDRAAAGEYEDRGAPTMRAWLQKTLASPWRARETVVADDFAAVCSALKTLIDDDGCRLVLTSGGTGPAPRDITPEATLAVADREIPGFGEEMRRVNLQYAPTAILSRQVAASRGRALVINLPGQPKAIGETLDGVFAAVPYCLELLGSPGLRTNPEVLAAFRPKSAR